MEKNGYVLWHVSFQLTGGTHISSVNALSSVELYVWEGRKGRGIQKRKWGLRWMKHPKPTLKITEPLTRLIRHCWGRICLQVMEVVVECTHKTCKSNCNEYGILFVLSVEGGSCFCTKVLAEPVSSDGTVQIIKVAIPERCKYAKCNSNEQEQTCSKWDWSGEIL